MEATITDKAERSGDEPTKSHAIQDLAPEHIRVVALRVQGKRWGEIAAALGVTPWTIWNWRQQHPEIDAMIAQEQVEHYHASRHGLIGLLPLTVEALRDVLTKAKPRDRVAAIKIVLETVKANPPEPTASGEESGGLSDDDLDAALDAVAELGEEPEP